MSTSATSSLVQDGVVEPFLIAAHPTGLIVGAVGPATALLYRIDPEDPSPEGITELTHLEAIPNGLAVTADAVWVTTPAGPLYRIPLAGPAKPRRVAFEGTPVAIAATSDSVYVADAAGRVVRLADPTGEIVDEEPLPEPTALAIGHGSVWVTSDEFASGGDAASSSVVRLDAETLQFEQAVPGLPNAPDDVVVTEGAVWVACLSGTVIRIDPRANTTIGDPIPLQDRAREMFIAATAEDVFVSVDAR